MASLWRQATNTQTCSWWAVSLPSKGSLFLNRLLLPPGSRANQRRSSFQPELQTRVWQQSMFRTFECWAFTMVGILTRHSNCYSLCRGKGIFDSGHLSRPRILGTDARVWQGCEGARPQTLPTLESSTCPAANLIPEQKVWPLKGQRSGLWSEDQRIYWP